MPSSEDILCNKRWSKINTVFYLHCETLAAKDSRCIAKYQKAFYSDPHRTLKIFPSDDVEQTSIRGRI